jgi:uncharacterized protein (TIRG00374 family)
MNTDSKKHTLYYTLLSLLVSVSACVFIFNRVALHEVLSAIAGVSFRAVFLFVLFSFAMSICRAWRYLLLLQSGHGRLRFSSLFFVTLIRNFFSDLLPARIGTLVYIYIVNKRLHVPMSSAFSSFAICFLFDIIAVALLAMTVSFGFFSEGRVFAIIISAGAVLCFIAFLLLHFLPELLHLSRRVIVHLKTFFWFDRQRKEKLLHFIAGLSKEIEKSKKDGTYVKVFVLSLVIRCFKYLSLYILFIGLIVGLGKDINMFPLVKVCGAMIAAELSASLPISGIAGFGAYEGTWSLVFQLLGYPEKLSILTAVSHHLITQVYGYALGVLSLLILLLPAMGLRKKQSGSESVMADRFFWAKLSLLVSAVFVLLLCLFPQVDFVQGKDDTAYDTAADLPSETLAIQGKIVFHKPDGIYVQRTGGEKELIVRGGRYPRWSNDGEQIVFLQGDRVMVARADGGNVQEVATADKPGAVCFHPDGRHVLYTDGKAIMKGDTATKKISIFLEGYRFKEIDISNDGKLVAATVKGLTGFSVVLWNLATGKVKKVARGCSASLSPDGTRVTVNQHGHKTLALFDTTTLKMVGTINAPSDNTPSDNSVDMLFDNHKWSNYGDWLVWTSEVNHHNIFIHSVASDIAYKITLDGDCDRGDLFVER